MRTDKYKTNTGDAMADCPGSDRFAINEFDLSTRQARISQRC